MTSNTTLSLGPGGARMRPALYARVSTDDRGQDPETQLYQLRQASGAQEARVYVSRRPGEARQPAGAVAEGEPAIRRHPL